MFSLCSRLSSSVSATLISAPGPERLIFHHVPHLDLLLPAHPLFTPLVSFLPDVYAHAEEKVRTHQDAFWDNAANMLFFCVCVLNKFSTIMRVCISATHKVVVNRAGWYSSKNDHDIVFHIILYR